MKGDGEGESEGAREKGYGKLNNDIKVSRRAFIKTTAALGAAVAGGGIPYNLTDIKDMFLEDDEELMMYPVIYDLKYESVGEKIFKEHFIFVKLWGCNWNCRWCPVKSTIFKDTVPILRSVDQITDLLLNFDADTTSTAIVIAGSGGEPLLQKEGVLKLIESLKAKANYPIFLMTNGSLIEENFINKANSLCLDGIMLFFYGLDDKWHRWYTGHSNETTIKALKMITERFEGQIVVGINLFPEIDMVTFENMCKFLHGINPNFVIRIICPIGYPDKQKHEECHERRRYEAEEIAMRYFTRIDRSIYFSKQTKNTRYLLEENERGRMNAIRSRKWINEGGSGGELLGDDKNKRGGEEDDEEKIL